MDRRILAAVAVVAVVATTLALTSSAMSVSAGETTDNSVQVYINIDATGDVQIYIEGSNLEDELGIIRSVEDGLRSLYGITGNIYYHVNEKIDTNQMQTLQRLRPIEAKLEQDKRDIQEHGTWIDTLRNAMSYVSQGVDDFSRRFDELAILVMCGFALTISFMTIMYCQTPSGRWVRELEERVKALETKKAKSK